MGYAIRSASTSGHKIIEIGFDYATPSWARANSALMEQSPFDGFGFRLFSETDSANFWSLMWGSRQFESTEFKGALADLNSIGFARLTDRFLNTSVLPGTVDWFSDAAFNVVTYNAAVAARFCKQSGSKGFMFDTEHYGSGIYNYATQNAIHPATLAAFQTKVRQRGSDWMNVVQGQFSDIVIIIFVAYYATTDPNYQLLASFLDGILDAAGPSCMIVDGYEPAFGIKTRLDLKNISQSIKNGAIAALSSSPDKYAQKVKFGPAIWIDLNHNTLGWPNPGNYAQNYWTPGAFETAMSDRWDLTDKYIWVWSETVNWYTGLLMPREYIDRVSWATRQTPYPV